MDNVNLSSEALLSNQGDMTSFRYSNSNIQFRTPKCLKRYTKVKEWDNEYIVCIGHSCYWTGNKPDLPVIPCFTSKSGSFTTFRHFPIFSFPKNDINGLRRDCLYTDNLP